MNVVCHDHIGKQEKATRYPGFVNCVAGDYFDGIRPEDWQSILCYRSNEQTRIVFRDGESHISQHISCDKENNLQRRGHRPLYRRNAHRQVQDLPRISVAEPSVR
jgi:hypothetical protein